MFNTEGRGELISCSDTPERKEAIFDLTALYNKIDKAERHVVLNGELEVVIEDRIKNGSQSSQLTWRMLTPANVEQVAGGFILRKEDKTLFVELPRMFYLLLFLQLRILIMMNLILILPLLVIR